MPISSEAVNEDFRWVKVDIEKIQAEKKKEADKENPCSNIDLPNLEHG